MAQRTFAVGDVHGDLAALERLLSRLPPVDAADTLVFLGDYVDRGPSSAQVVARIRALPGQVPARVVTLRGNHEDAWLRVRREGWPEFTLPPGNGCLACLRSYLGRGVDEPMRDDEFQPLHEGSFLPAEVVAWMDGLPLWYEDAHALYVHAGVPRVEGRWLHPREAPAAKLLWQRDPAFFTDYRGKLVVCGHTTTRTLPPEGSSYTPDCPHDLWAGTDVYVLDTGAGKKDGYLTALELPGGVVYESRG